MIEIEKLRRQEGDTDSLHLIYVVGPTQWNFAELFFTLVKENEWYSWYSWP